MLTVMSATRRTTVYFDSELHRALRVKALETERSVSDLVNQALRSALSEDAEDLTSFRKRAKEPALSFERVIRDLKRRGRL